MNDGKSSAVERWWALGQVLILLFGILAVFVIAGAIGPTAQQIVMLLGLPLSALSAWFFMRKDGKSGPGIGLKRPDSWPRTIAIAFGAYIAIVVIMRFVLNPIISATLGSWWDPTQFDALKGNAGQWAVNVFFVAWFHAAFCEETVFRGFFFQRLEKALGGSTAALVAALVLQGGLFGLAHSANGVAALVETWIAGILIGLLFIYMRRNLWANIITHALLDTTIFTLVFFGAQRFLLPG
ncbi:MAG TPA: type II CAAX endopeptidase family protein [Fimbriimonadaceae bacterium]|nr:type II CAAX endopeptidase family protein [Fimbriimonadaceae bacterium]